MIGSWLLHEAGGQSVTQVRGEKVWMGHGWRLWVSMAICLSKPNLGTGVATAKCYETQRNARAETSPTVFYPDLSGQERLGSHQRTTPFH